MKKIKDCKYYVEIVNCEKDGKNTYFFTAETRNDNGLAYHDWFLGKYYRRENSAIKNWLNFAKLNGIKKFTINE